MAKMPARAKYGADAAIDMPPRRWAYVSVRMPPSHSSWAGCFAAAEDYRALIAIMQHDDDATARGMTMGRRSARWRR